MEGQREPHERIIRDPIDIDKGTQLPGLRLRDAQGSPRNAVTAEEFGEHVGFCGRITISRRLIPAFVEALVDQAREEDLDELQARVDDAINWGEAADGSL